jgi:catechol 2,3-dioxygenase-like lactoylglutathione lyase family enzyme
LCDITGDYSMATNYPINPRVRAYGKARIDIASRAKNQAQWEELWKIPANSFPFVWGESWKQCIEYRVDDFPAEVGFYIDILGLPINALDSGYAMFTSPQGDFFFSVVSTPHNEPSTPPDAFRLQFMLKDIIATTSKLQQRGIDFEQSPQPLQPGSSLSIASFRTPHGICVELWGKVDVGSSSELTLNLSKDKEDGDEMQNEDEDEFTEDRNGDNSGEDGSDDDDPGENLDNDEGEDDFKIEQEEEKFDEDGDNEVDEIEGNEDVNALTSIPRKNVTINHFTLPKEAKSNSPDKIANSNTLPGPDYVDLDIT